METYTTYITTSNNTNFFPAYGSLEIAKVHNTAVIIKTPNKR